MCWMLLWPACLACLAWRACLSHLACSCAALLPLTPTPPSPRSDPELSALLFGEAVRREASSSDLLSESCLLPELQLQHGGSSGMLHKGSGSSGVLLEYEQPARASSSGSARMQRGGSDVPELGGGGFGLAQAAGVTRWGVLCG